MIEFISNHFDKNYYSASDFAHGTITSSYPGDASASGIFSQHGYTVMGNTGSH